jgi:hypothetical protein
VSADAAMHEAYVRRLDETGARYVVVAGTRAQRMRQATAAVDALLAERIAASGAGDPACAGLGTRPDALRRGGRGR